MADRKQAIFGAIATCAVAIAIIRPGGLDMAQAATLGIVLVTLGLWATALVPPFLTSLIFFVALLVPGLADQSVVFSGFTSTAIWLATSGFVIGAAIKGAGLGQRLGNHVAPHLSASYPRLIGGLMILSAVLGFLMPSSIGRAIVLLPVALAMADALGFGKGSHGRVGVALCVALGANMPSFAVLPANLPNMVLSGAAETNLGIRFGYADYLLLHYPVLGVLKSVVLVGLILRFHPARVDGHGRGQNGPAQVVATGGRRQGLVLAVLLGTLVLWMSDGVHGIQPAWVGLAAAVVLLIPRFALVSVAEFREAVDFGTLLLIAGVLAVGAVVAGSGLGAVLADDVAQILPLAPGRDFVNFLSLAGLAILTGLVTTIAGVPAVLTPLAPDLAAATGFSTEAVMMTQVIGFSTVIFPYQAAPLVLAMGLAGEPVRALARVTMIAALVTVLVLVPLDFLWWRLLGWI